MKDIATVWCVVIFRKIYQKLHQLHAVVLPEQMEGRTKHHDEYQSVLEKVIAILQSEKAAVIDQDERQVMQYIVRSFGKVTQLCLH